MRQKRRVAVVVGSGGIKCAASLGLWQVLQREGIGISMAVGSSGGSIYAAMMAHFNSVYQNNVLRTTFAFANLAHHGELIPVLPRLAYPIGTFDSDQVPHLIEAGRSETEAALPYIRRLLAEPAPPGA